MIGNATTTIFTTCDDAPDYIEMSNLESSTSIYYCNALALIILRQAKVTRLGKIPQGVFRCILEYCVPAMLVRVNEHYKYNPLCPINFWWPQ